jgi:hypothetical protein
MKRLVIVVAFIAAASAAAFMSAIGRAPNVPVAQREMVFDGFPLDRPRVVEFGRPQLESDEPTLYARHTASALGVDLDAARRREVADQVRDWLLMTILSASQLSADELNEALYDLPPVRRGQFDRIAKFDYAETRARAIRNGDVIAVIPSGSKEERADALAHILDEQRKNTGTIGTVVQVFEYELASDLESAKVVRRAPIEGRSLFSPESGYTERSIASSADLHAFLAAIDDLTYARRDGGTLVVGGRRLQSRHSRNIRVEDIAAIWQSEQSEAGREQGSGFSLDPTFEYGKLRRTLQEVVAPSLRQRGASDLQIQSLYAAVNAKDIGTFLSLLNKACTEVLADASHCGDINRSLVEAHRFQAARYDGNLKGTEVGMVLFYTDLLMKLWAQDYERATPRAVAGFPNRTAMEVAAIYRTEVRDTPTTRLWLGSLSDGYQTAKGGSELLLARIATRVFAVPNDSITGEDRKDTTEPHIYNRTFMTWWNDHYEEVARYEPEYERLNEIMKWSQVIGWLNTSYQHELLGFLDQVTVNRTNRFTEWIQRHRELTFRNWQAVAFKPAGYEGTTTEAIAILQSRPFQSFGETTYWSGGVSLARRAELAERAALADDVPMLARRARLDYAKSNIASGELRTTQAIEYSLRNAGGGSASTIARVPTGQRLRGLVSEFRHSDLERTITKTSDGLRIHARAISADVGDFQVTRTAEGFSAGWRARAVDRGQAIARRASRAPNMDAALVRDPEVEAVIRLADDSYLVKAVDADGWMKITAGSADSKSVRAGFDARVSGNGSGARNLDIVWPDDTKVAAQLRDAGWIRVDATETHNGSIWVADARGPPAGVETRQVNYAGMRISFAVDPQDGRVLVRGSGLSAELRKDPARLRAVIQGADSGPTGDTAIVSVLERGDLDGAGGGLAGEPAKSRAGLEARLVQEQRVTARLLEEGQFREARLHADALLNLWGEQPEFRLQRALAQLGEQDVKGAAGALDAPFKRPVSQQFLDEIDKRIADKGLSAIERENLTSVRREAAWHNAKARDPINMPGDLHAVADGKTLRLEYRTDTLAARPTDASGIADGRTMLYVEDTPGLNNIDWSPSTLRETINGLVSGGRIDVRLLSVDLKRYSPSRIVEVQSGTTLTRVTPVTTVIDALPTSGCRDNDDDAQGCQVYIVRRPAVSTVSQRSPDRR